MRTRFYVDGFNLYYAAIRGTALHWLDLASLCDSIAQTPVDRIIYCTARVSSTRRDPGKADRQDAYLKAIVASGRVEVVEGKFMKRTRQVALKGCRCSPATLIWVRVREEKGTDVNLATRLLHDAHTQQFEQAFVMSGDSDLAEAIRIVRDQIGKRVVVVNPSSARPSDHLRTVASDYMGLFPGRVKRYQLPEVVRTLTGEVRKPQRWQTARDQALMDEVVIGQCPGCGAITLAKVGRDLTQTY